MTSEQVVSSSARLYFRPLLVCAVWLEDSPRQAGDNYVIKTRGPRTTKPTAEGCKRGAVQSRPHRRARHLRRHRTSCDPPHTGSFATCAGSAPTRYCAPHGHS